MKPIISPVWLSCTHVLNNMAKPEPIMLLDLPIIPFGISQKFYPLFLIHSHVTTLYSFLIIIFIMSVIMMSTIHIHSSWVHVVWSRWILPRGHFNFIHFFYYACRYPIIPALYDHQFVTYYSQYHAGIIGSSVNVAP